MPKATIRWTLTDEAPMLATASLLPIVRAFTKPCDIDVTLEDISVAGRVLAQFPERLGDSAKDFPDVLTKLGNECKTPSANVIKLPNISASIPQLQDCIKELQAQGFDVPDYPEDPKTDEEKDIKAKYGKVLGSAVNPVLREGNSDRRAATSVKDYAKKYPHKMGPWSKDSKTHVSHMSDGDFFGSEQSYTCPADAEVSIEFTPASGPAEVLKTVKVVEGEVIDASFMSCKKLCEFYEEEMQKAKDSDVLLSLHLKATMMKVSDPILFGHCVRVYFKDLLSKHAPLFDELKVNLNNGFGDLVAKIATLPEEQRKEIEADIEACYAARPRLAMVNSDKGITNLHVPSDVIIDASMPSMIRGMDGLGGGMWCPDSKPGARDSHLCDTNALIPDRCYAGVFAETIEFCKTNGAFDPATMGTVPNVGLMAQKAEEYGSHDKTFEMKAKGVMKVVDAESKNTIFEMAVERGDIWRMCQTKDPAIQDWIKLAVTRARASSTPVVFWLNVDRAHDREIINKIEKYLPTHDTKELDIQILSPVEACRLSLERAKRGEDTISATGNVLRDYNTDLFPILELGTSAKMLSIVPMLAGGGMYETGAGGSAPKHVEQFQKENHLRWDSLGEFLALQVSIEEIGAKTGDAMVKALAKALDDAVARFLDENKNPGRKVMQIDNRGSHFYLALYWAEALAKCGQAELESKFADVAGELAKNEEAINKDMIDCQGPAADFGGYYKPDLAKLETLMRPSQTFNAALQKLE
jgi:isocitrate dehydrogenase